MAGARRCVVFGGSGMLGRAVCEALGRAGARVGFTYYRGRAVADELLARLPDSAARAVDLTRMPDLERACDELAGELGGVDAFVHAAGIGTTQEPGGIDKVADIFPEGWERLMAVNVGSAFFGVKRLVSHLAAARGNVVLMGSLDSLRPVPGPVYYAASKGAVRAMVLSLAKELGPSGVKVNMIAPGMIDGGLSRAMPADLHAEYLRHCGIRRLARADEIAAVVVFLALENTYVTGQALTVDGAL